MSLSYKDTGKKATPIAKIIDDNRVIYCQSDLGWEINHKSRDSGLYKCIACGKVFSTKKGYAGHVSKVCPVNISNEVSFELDTSPNEINPLPTIKRQIVYIAGSQDSGKSFRIKEYCNYWVKLFPKKKVILITRLAKDETLKEIEDKIIRYIPDESLISNPINLEEFSNSLCIFDDITSSSWSPNFKLNSLIQKYLYNLLDDIVQNGRHHNIHVLITSHQITDYKRTRALMQDATDFVIFPATTGVHHIDTFLSTYVGMNKKQIEKIHTYDNKSRWIWIHKNAPRYVLHAHGAYLYDHLYKS